MEGSSAKPLVSVSGLSKRFSETLALDALDLALHPGEVVGLLGPNGAGKTTTLKVLLGLLKPSQGHASILGLDCTRDSRRVKERVGFTPDGLPHTVRLLRERVERRSSSSRSRVSPGTRSAPVSSATTQEKATAEARILDRSIRGPRLQEEGANLHTCQRG